MGAVQRLAIAAPCTGRKPINGPRREDRKEPFNVTAQFAEWSPGARANH